MLLFWCLVLLTLTAVLPRIGLPQSVLFCGLFGYSGKNPVDLLRLSWLAAENQSRGEDSTGVYGNHLAKSVGAAKSFIQSAKYREAVEGATTIIGHTRKATTGAKTEANAHPFELLNPDTKQAVVGTHNGMIWSYIVEKYTEKYGLTPSEVDSEFIFKMLLHHDFDYDKALSEIEGAMALAFIRKNFPDHLYLYKRQSRPLHVGFIGTDMYYSSEVEPLHLIGCDVSDTLEDDTLYIFKKGELVEVSSVKKPFITTIREDESLTTFMARATMEEKRVVGVFGAPAKTHMVAYPGKQMSMLPAHGPKKTKQTTGNAGTVVATNQPHRIGTLQLFHTLNHTVFADLVDPVKARFYNSGNPSSCYLILQLLDTRDRTKVLPGWIIRVRGNPSLSCVTTYNGIGGIEIPYSMTGEVLNLEVVCPLMPEVVYKTAITKTIAGRVMEVALSIPFPAPEEKTKANQADNVRTSSDSNAISINEGSSVSVLSFPEYLELRKYSEPDILSLQRKQSPLFIRSEGRYPSICCVPSIASLQDNPDKRPYFVKEDNVLDMSDYEVMVNLDEVEGYQAQLEELMAEPDPDILEVRSLLSSINNYFVYLGDYLKSRADFNEQQELEEEESNWDPQN